MADSDQKKKGRILRTLPFILYLLTSQEYFFFMESEFKQDYTKKKYFVLFNVRSVSP